MADFLGMMKQAAQLQSKMQEMQEQLGHVEVEGISGGGLVSVRMTAKMEVKAVNIDPSLMKPEEREVLQDPAGTAVPFHPTVFMNVRGILGNHVGEIIQLAFTVAAAGAITAA